MSAISDAPDLLRRLITISVRPSDSDEERLRKMTLVTGVVFICCVAPIWVLTYAAHGLWLSAAIPFSYILFTIASLFVLAYTNDFRSFSTAQFSLMLLLPMFLQWSLGGFVASSGIILWSFVTPVGALLCLGPRRSVPWFVAFIAAIMVTAMIDPLLTRAPAELSATVRNMFFAVNFTAVTTTSFLIMRYFVKGREEARAELDEKHHQLLAEQERSEQLLLNILPQPVADRLKSGESPIADRVADVSVLFADITGFTQLASQRSPAQLVWMLDQLFTSFDRLADELGVEKIKTIGDSYMLVGGLTQQRPDHLEAVAEIALTMTEAVTGFTERFGEALALRIGIDVGPVVAGVIGQRRFSYDLWGDTVNTASRMASYGIPGRIQVTSRVRERLCSTYAFEPRGPLDIKGKGQMEVFLLVGKTPASMTRVAPLAAPEAET